MKVIIVLSAFVAVSWAGIITHEDHKGHGKATSFQSIKLDHFHPVAVYIKKEDLKYLEHPVEIGKTGASVKQEHGNKHEHGFAVQDVNHHINHHGHEEHGHEHQIQVHSGAYGQQGHHYQEPIVHEEPQHHHQRLNVPVHYQVQQQQQQEEEAQQDDDEELQSHGHHAVQAQQDHQSGHYQGYQGGIGNYQLANVDGYALEGHASSDAGTVAVVSAPGGQRYTTVDLSAGHGKS